MSKRLLLILNPNAGQKRIRKHIAELLSLYGNAGYVVTAAITAPERPGDVLVRELGADADLIVAAGGDGTFNAVVSGLVSAGMQKPLGFIPCGSTNDFARSLGLRTQIMRAAEDTLSPDRRMLDVGMFGNRVFTYVASTGIFTRSSYTAPQSVKNALGHLAYLLEGIRELGNVHPQFMRISCGQQTVEGEFIFAAVCNSTSLGGLIRLDRKVVDMNDGLLEVLLIRMPKNLPELTGIIRALNARRYDKCKQILFFSTPSLIVETPITTVWSVDGERQEGASAVTVRNIRDAVYLAVPTEQQPLLTF